MKPTYSPPIAATRQRRNLLTGVWAALSLTAMGFILSSGCNAPAVDEWEFVAELTGQAPIRPWLWAQHNEHRLPLSKFVYITQFRLTHDFRSGMLLQVGLLSALSFGLMRLASRLRGYPYWTDLFFPVSLLHLGHWENFLLGYQICFTLFTILVTGLIVVAVFATRRTAFRTGLLGGGLTLLIALTGGFGLPVVIPVAGWLGYLAVVLWQDRKKRRAVCLLLLAGLALVYLRLYFVDFQRPEHIPTSTDWVAILLVTAQVLGMVFGIGFSAIWWAVVAGEVVVASATIALLLRLGKDPEVRPASVGLIAIVLGVSGIALAIGIARAGFGPEMGLWPRYSLLMWPLLCAAYLTWVKAGRAGEHSGLVKWIPITLCVAAALAFPTNTGAGLYIAAKFVTRDRALQADIDQGIPDATLIEKHFPGSRNEGQELRARWGIPMLREAGVSIFAVGEHRGGHSPLWKFGALAVAITGVLLGRWLWHLGKAVQAERARELFRLQHERFEEQLLQSASNTGLPRGLRWHRCRITGDAMIARDTTTGGILALVPVLVEFEPEVGSDMEDNPAAREPRPATAVFLYESGTWFTAGRVVFNHTPEQAIATFSPQLQVIHHDQH
jgi:hypothetical protein